MWRRICRTGSFCAAKKLFLFWKEKWTFFIGAGGKPAASFALAFAFSQSSKEVKKDECFSEKCFWRTFSPCYQDATRRIFTIILHFLSNRGTPCAIFMTPCPGTAPPAPKERHCSTRPQCDPLLIKTQSSHPHTLHPQPPPPRPSLPFPAVRLARPALTFCHASRSSLACLDTTRLLYRLGRVVRWRRENGKWARPFPRLATEGARAHAGRRNGVDA
jgi:hypothetical protein